MSSVLEARGLVAGYGDRPVVHGLDIVVEPGEVVALLGVNGAGKTTTMMACAGVLPLLAGEVLVNGEPTKEPLHRRARRGLAIVTETRSVFMQMSTLDNLKVARCDVKQALELFPELKSRLKVRAGLLSGGEQQMLSLARALTRSPSVLIADELSLGLAPLIVDRLLGAVLAAARRGVGVLLVEQHISKALQVADRAYVLNGGRITLDGRSEELRERLEDVEASYLTDRVGSTPRHQ